MPGRPKKRGAGFASALGKEIKAAISRATEGGTLPTSKDLKKLTNTIRSLIRTITKLPKLPAVKNIGKAVYRKKGPKSRAIGCSVAGCARPHYAKGLCASHYNMDLRRRKLEAEGGPAKRGPKPGRRGRRGRKPKVKAVRGRRTAARNVKTCSMQGCNEKHYAKRLCRKHYAAKQYADKKKARK